MPKKKTQKTKRHVVRINGLLKEVITVYDTSGKLLHKAVNPLMLEFHARDVMQILIGATLLAIPIGFTEEVWVLGETLPTINVFILAFISLLFIAIFVYYNAYRGHHIRHLWTFAKRSVATYLIALIVVGVFLTLIQKAPWSVDSMLALKRVILVAFPASMSAAIADMIK